MKRFILMTIMSLVAFATVGQGRYYTMQELGGDLLKYIERNYEDNPERYIGQTLEFFVDECELVLEDFIPTPFRMAEGPPHPLNGKIISLYFDFYSGDYEYTVGLHFAPPYIHSMDDFYQIEDSDYTEPWQDKFYQMFKDYTIDKVYIIKRKYDYNKKRYVSIKNYRRP